MTTDTSRRPRLNLAAAVATLAATASLGAGAAAAQDYPSERLDWTIAFGAGGGNDIMARTLIDIINRYELYPEDIVAENRAGGSGAVGWGYLFAQAGSGYDISTTSGSFITTPLQADTGWEPSEFTPVALLATDDLVLVVNGDSEIETFEQWIEAAKTNPPSIGGIGAVNVDFIVPTVLSELAGFEFEYVSFNDAGELNTALLSGALDAVAGNPGEILGLIESGDLRALAYSGRETPEALGDIPTFGEAGYEVGISMPRGLILPPDAPQEAVDWWQATIARIVETPEWQAYLDTNLLTENVLYGQEFEDFLTTTQGSFAEILRESGAIQ